MLPIVVCTATLIVTLGKFGDLERHHTGPPRDAPGVVDVAADAGLLCDSVRVELSSLAPTRLRRRR